MWRRAVDKIPGGVRLAEELSGFTMRGLTRTVQRILSAAEDVLFEYRYGLETAKVVEVNRLDISAEDKQHSVRYKPTRVRYFHKLMQALSLPKSLVFVDVGCGKGRVLLLAAQYGFRRIVGLELSPRLCEIARDNIGVFRRRHLEINETTVVCTNVLQYQLTDDEGIFFLFWPFDRSVTMSFLEMVRQSIDRKPRNVWLIINEFQFLDLLDGDSYFDQTQYIVYGASEFNVYCHLADRYSDADGVKCC